MKKNNKKGFTLVELVIVVAVMAILVAVAIPTVSSITKTARENVDKSNAQTIESMLKLKEAELNETVAAGGLSKEQVTAALTAAKLDIDNGTFKYEPTTGKVMASSEAGAAGSITITYTSGALSVS